MADNQSQLEAVFNNMKEGITVLDAGHNVIRTNRAAVVFGKPFLLVLHAKDAG